MSEAEPSADEYQQLHRSVSDPDGHRYQVFVSYGYGGVGPVSLGADEGASAAAHMLVKLANRILGRIPQHTTSYTFPIVYVLAQTDGGSAKSR